MEPFYGERIESIEVVTLWGNCGDTVVTLWGDRGQSGVTVVCHCGGAVVTMAVLCSLWWNCGHYGTTIVPFWCVPLGDTMVTVVCRCGVLLWSL